MTPLRALLRTRPLLAAWFATLALALRLVPAGYMPAIEQGALTVTLCPGGAAMVAAMPGMRHDAPGHGGHDAPSRAACPFAAAAAPALASGPSPAIVPPAAPVPIATTVVLVTRAPSPTPYLRPPGRAPPAFA